MKEVKGEYQECYPGNKLVCHNHLKSNLISGETILFPSPIIL